MIGDYAVGKTSILNALLGRPISGEYDPTVGGEHHRIPVDGERDIDSLDIWDTSGTEQYRALNPIFFRRAQVAVITYDVTRRESFEALETWLDFYQVHVEDSTHVIIVGNKIDLSDAIQVPKAEGEEWASRKNYPFVEVSAVKRTNLGAFTTILIESAKSVSCARQARRDLLPAKRDPETNCCC
jgi:small GTP-binding protein